MYWYTIGQTLTQQEHAPAPEQPAVVLLTSEELSHQPALPGLERMLHHPDFVKGRYDTGFLAQHQEELLSWNKED